MPELDDTGKLAKAADDYAAERVKNWAFQFLNENQYRTLLEIAFIEGAKWSMRYANEKLDRVLEESNARS